MPFYEVALKYGLVQVQLMTILLVGPPGVGKSSLSHCLIGKMLPNRRRSSGSISVSPKLQAEHLTNRTFTWTELSLDDVFDATAKMIAPMVADKLDKEQMMQPKSKIRMMKKAMKTAMKKMRPHNIKRLSSSSSSSSRTTDSKKRSPLQSANSLEESVIKIVTDDTTATNGEAIKSFITIMDSGGQKAFFNLYPIFVRNPSLVMVVFKMTDAPDCIWKPLPKEEFYGADEVFTDLHQVNQSAADLIKHTMANISTYTDTIDSSNTTRVCCVGTHKDQVSEATIAAIDQQLAELISESGYAPLVLTRNGKCTKYLFPVNNLVAGHPSLYDEAIQELREIPLRFLADKEMDTSLHDIPIRWMNLELKIREHCQLNQVKYMSYKEALEIALSNEIEDEEELLEMLQYFHNLSLLLYYHDIPYLKDIIIIDNNLILEMASKLVEFTFTGNGIASCDFNNFKYCGIFSEGLLNHHNFGDEINPLGLLHLLISLNIISPLPEHLYFMPCVLPNVEEFAESPDDFLSSNYGTQQFTSIAIQFSSGSLPRGVFCSLLVRLMNSERTATRWALCRSSSHNHKKVFSNLVTFTLPSGHHVSLHDKMSHCQIQIHHQDHKATPVIHQRVLNTILDLLMEVCSTMSLCADLRVGFQCSNKQCVHSDSHFVLSEVVLPLYDSDSYSICRLSGQPSKLTEDQKIWFKVRTCV